MTGILAARPIARISLIAALPLALSGLAIALDGVVAQFPGRFGR